MKFNTSVSLLLRVVASIILLQTLYFKFTEHPESVLLFSKLGVEPWGRIATGIIEFITAILLIIPYTAFVGALSGVVLMLGAIFSHLMVVGIQSNGDGGELFMLAMVVLMCCLVTLWLQKEEGMIRFRKIFRHK